MLRNYLLIALRNLNRQLSYSLINIIGLAIGLACSLVIFMYIYGEWSYDRHFDKASRIYRIGITFFNLPPFAVGPEALGETLPKEFEGIEAFTRVARDASVLFTKDDHSYYELAYYTDSSFFQVFSYEFIQGDPKTALAKPGSMVMTKSAAEKYFNRTDPFGQAITIGKDKKLYTVTGIVKDDKRNSQLKSSIWLSNEDLLTQNMLWTSASMYNYVLLKENNTKQDLDLALDQLLKKHIFPHAMGVPENISFAEYKEHANAVKFYVHELRDVHLKSALNYEISPTGNEANLYTFAAISIFILLLASVNFVNLTTAQASKRAKEVGIRKTSGSSRGNLIVQFLMESVIMTTLAMMVSLVLAQTFLDVFHMISGETLLDTLLPGNWSLVVLFGFTLLVGILSGIYPAFYLTSFKPAKVLKGSVPAAGAMFRNVLVVSQFSISIGLMICSAIVMRQMNFMQTKDLGFNQESVVTIDNIAKLGSSVETFRNELAQRADVLKVSLHSGEPGSKSVVSASSYQTDYMDDAITINTFFADAHFLELMNFQLLKGRDFLENSASDSSAVILNEAAVEVLGLKDPLGAELNKDIRVIGVVRNFHWESLRTAIAPVVIRPGKDYFQLAFRLKNDKANDFLKTAEAKWKELVPDEPIQYHFLDENFGTLLKKEQLLSRAVGFFTILAVFISCLGLYGLSAFTAEQRTKEIGIRKALGATPFHVVTMLNKKFVPLVTISVLIAVPSSNYIMMRWMEGFAYQTDLPFWIFLTPIAIAFVIALLTVSFHSLKAALVNPVETLKYE